MAIAATSAVTGEILKSFDELTSEELEAKLARAAAAAESYRLTSVEQRAGWVVKDSPRAAQGTTA
jgi:succinate-semialdehyde dehydrogenase/glutarate-semialdehyde dehydrogenase